MLKHNEIPNDALGNHLNEIANTPVLIQDVLDDGTTVTRPNPKWQEMVDWLETEEALAIRANVGHSKSGEEVA